MLKGCTKLSGRSSSTRAPLAPPAEERALRRRRRLQLLNACIEALHQYGPSRTTVDKVVAIAGMSPGIVSFYFDSKDAMLVAVLQHVAEEFEAHVLAPVTALASDPATALTLLVERYFDPAVASPQKISVWFAFWSETNSRGEYHRICGGKDAAFAKLVADLVKRLIPLSGQTGLDPDAIALGLIGALDMTWQGILLQDAADVDYAAARQRCMNYLRSIFPRVFGAPKPARRRSAKARPVTGPS